MKNMKLLLFNIGECIDVPPSDIEELVNNEELMTYFKELVNDALYEERVEVLDNIYVQITCIDIDSGTYVLEISHAMDIPLLIACGTKSSDTWKFMKNNLKKMYKEIWCKFLNVSMPKIPNVDAPIGVTYTFPTIDILPSDRCMEVSRFIGNFQMFLFNEIKKGEMKNAKLF